MNLKEKREIIAKNKDPAIAALDAVLDTLYNITDSVTNDKERIKTALFKNKKAEQMAVTLHEDIKKYEPIKLKLENDDFNLSQIEISYIAICFFFCSERAKNQIESMTKAKELCDTLLVILNSPDETTQISNVEIKEKFQNAINLLTNKD